MILGNLEAYAYDKSNAEHSDYLFSCVSDEGWRTWCAVPLAHNVPLVLSLLYYVYNKKQTDDAIHLLAQCHGVWIGLATIKLYDTCAEIIGGIANNRVDSGVGVMLYIYLIDLIWKQLPQLPKIITHTLENNVRIQKLNKAIGFRKTGVRTKGFYNVEQNTYHDLYVYEILRDEFINKPFVKRLISGAEYKMDDEIDILFANMRNHFMQLTEKCGG